MKKSLILATICMLVLSSCGKQGDEESTQSTEKKPFYIQTQKFSDFSSQYSLEKVWKVSSMQEIEIKWNISGKVSEIYVKPGDSVKKWQILLRMWDTIWSYTNSLQKAGLSIERAKINYDSTKISLDTQVFNAQLALDSAQKDLSAYLIESENNLKTLEDAAKKSNLAGAGSRSSLEVQNLQTSIDTLTNNYNSQVQSDNQSIANNKSTIKKEFVVFENYMNDVIELSDRVMWITDKYENENDEFDMFLWARNKSQKYETLALLREVILSNESSDFAQMRQISKSQSINELQMREVLEAIELGYDDLQNMLLNLEITLNNSIASEGSLGQSQIDTFTSSINWYQSSLQAASATFLSQASGIRTFLETYVTRQDTLKKNISSQEKQLQIALQNFESSEIWAQSNLDSARANIDDRILDLRKQVTTSKRNLDDAIKNRSVTLRNLQNSISDAGVNYETAQNNVEKLTITSPIDGVVQDVLIDSAQELQVGTPLISLVADRAPKLEFSLSSDQKLALSYDSQVQVIKWGNSYKAQIYSIGDVADQNLNFTVEASLESTEAIKIWDVVELEIEMNSNFVLMPLNRVEATGNNSWKIFLLENETITQKNIVFWNIYGDMVEIKSCENCENAVVILSDISNYDANKFTLSEK